MKKAIIIISIILGVAAIAAAFFYWNKYEKTRNLSAGDTE